jgi:OOP family OmpA-OmpF porin
MKKKILFCALMGAMGAAQSVMAQDFDDRWYVSGSVGFNFQDNDRNTNNAIFGTLGVGKFFSPYWSVELNANYQNPRQSANQDQWWSQAGISIDALYHFRKEGRNWWPYLRAGIGYQKAWEEFVIPGPTSPATRKDGHIAGILGAGLQAQYGRYGVRTELGVRLDGDNNSVTAPNKSYFTDFLASVGVTVALGPEPVKAVVPEPAPVAPPNCADLDDDGDGVNNCNDKCPGSQAGQTIGPDGCPVPVTIDLRGVNFDFDKYNLRPDAVATLNEAIEVLKKYPQLKVEVAGHTDSIGTDAYNQKLSERRARAVYDYLVKNGVDAGRLMGPDGFGESRPIAPNTNPDGTDNPQGRAQNRRTELNVQN